MTQSATAPVPVHVFGLPVLGQAFACHLNTRSSAFDARYAGRSFAEGRSMGASGAPVVALIVPHPVVLSLPFMLQGGGGATADCAHAAAPETEVHSTRRAALITWHNQDAEIRYAVDAGIRAFLDLGATPEQICAALHAAASGAPFCSPSLADAVTCCLNGLKAAP